jgi:hypothetical protein
VVVGVDGSPDDAGRLGAIDQLDRAVVPQQQILGHLADRRASAVVVPGDRQQELMLGGREPEGSRAIVAPAQETPELGSEGQEAAVVLVKEYRNTILSYNDGNPGIPPRSRAR